MCPSYIRGLTSCLVTSGSPFDQPMRRWQNWGASCWFFQGLGVWVWSGVITKTGLQWWRRVLFPRSPSEHHYIAVFWRDFRAGSQFMSPLTLQQATFQEVGLLILSPSPSRLPKRPKLKSSPTVHFLWSWPFYWPIPLLLSGLIAPPDTRGHSLLMTWQLYTRRSSLNYEWASMQFILSCSIGFDDFFFLLKKGK